MLIILKFSTAPPKPSINTVLVPNTLFPSIMALLYHSSVATCTTSALRSQQSNSLPSTTSSSSYTSTSQIYRQQQPQQKLRSTFTGVTVQPSKPARAATIAPVASGLINSVRDLLPSENGKHEPPKSGDTFPLPVDKSEPRLGTTGKPLYTTLAGLPVSDDDNSVRIGQSGTLVFEDLHLLEKNAHFNRERVPERVVHAKGAGAHGYFEVTKDITDICRTGLFSEVGKKTPLFARFSSVTAESGYPDTGRDPRGFAVKFYTEEGIWDMVGNNTPVFFVRDPLKFPDLIHSQKRNPQTHMKDASAYWDFASLVPETLHQILINFSPRGVPYGYRHMHGYGSHTFKMINKEGKAHWVKFHFLSNQGIKNLTHEEALEKAGVNPDHQLQDLFDAIKDGHYPSWTFYLQVMPSEDAKTYRFDPFDLTKVWLHKDYPLREVGKMVLNRNVTNYFAEVEQSAFSPSHMPPGIEASPDPMLQSRLFAYDDAERYRLGGNYLSLPINKCPFAKVGTYARDGFMVHNDNGGSKPNYYPNSFEDLPRPDPGQPDVFPYEHEGGIVSRGPPKELDDDDFLQPAMLWRTMSKEDQQLTVTNIAGHIQGAQDFIIKRQLEHFRRADAGLGQMVEEALGIKMKSPDPFSLVA